MDWINVEDRLPEEDGYYWVAEVHVEGFDRGRRTFFNEDWSQFFVEDDEWRVTHWMPLPEPPRSE